MFFDLNLIEYYYMVDMLSLPQNHVEAMKDINTIQITSQEKETFTVGIFSVRF